MVLGYAIIAVPTGIVTVESSAAARAASNTQACPACGAGNHDNDAVIANTAGPNCEGRVITRRLFADAIQVGRRAQKDFSVGKSRRAQGVGAVEGVFSDQLVSRSRLDNGGLRGFTGDVDFAVGENR
jgi:hypothetical protein